MTERPKMTTNDGRRLVAAIHDTPTMLVLAVAGGGNAIITDLLDVGGASRTVLEIVVPYAEAAMVDFAGAPPEGRGAVSAEQAEAMARAALERARTLASETPSIIGVAITAALVSDRPKRGEHRAHLAVASADGDDVLVFAQEVILSKGEHDRAGEDRVVADAALSMVAAACGLSTPLQS